MSVRLATCAGVEVDPDSPLLLAALAEEGLAARLAVWDDPAEEWGAGLVVIRSTWDYAGRREQFLAWARGVARLENPYRVVEYSSDKHYLVDLERRGVPVVESRIVEVGEDGARVAGDLLGGDAVVKPAVGAGSIDAARYRPGERDAALAHVARLHARGRAALVQPYVASVDAEGETAVVVVDGEVTHLMRKGAMLNTEAPERTPLFRFEQTSLAPRDAEAEHLALSVLHRVAGLSDETLLYARVDLVRRDDGWAVLELELVEPSLFLSHHPPAAAALARAVARRL